MYAAIIITMTIIIVCVRCDHHDDDHCLCTCDASVCDVSVCDASVCDESVRDAPVRNAPVRNASVRHATVRGSHGLSARRAEGRSQGGLKGQKEARRAID